MQGAMNNMIFDYLSMSQKRDNIATVECELETLFKLSNGTIFNDLE